MPPETKKPQMPPNPKHFAPTPPNLGSILVANGYPSGYPAGLIMSQRKVNYPVAKGFRLWGCIAFFLLMIGILVLITPPDKDLDEEDFGLDPPIEFDLDQEISERITKKKREQPVEKVIEEHEEIDPESHESAEEAVIEPESPEIDEPEEQRNDENEENDDNDDNDEKPKEIEEEAVVEEQTDVDVEEIKEVTAGDTADKDGSETTEPPLADKVRSVRRKGVVAAPSKKPSDSNRDDEVRKVDKPKPEARKKPVSKAETIKEKTERVENTKGFSSVRKTLLVVVNPVPFGLLKVGSTLFSTLFDAVHYKPEKVGTVVEQNHDNFIPTTLEIRYYHNKRDSDDIQQTEAEDEKDNREEPKIQTKRISTKTEPKSENSEETPIEPAKQPAKKVVKSSKTAEKPPALVRRTIDEDLKKFRNRRVDDDRFEVTPLEKLGVLRVRRRNDAQREQFLKEKSQKTIVSTSEIVRRVIHRKGSQGGSVLIDKQSEIKATPTQTVPEATRTVVELSYSRKKGSILASGLPSKVESKVEEEIQPATQPRKTQTSNASQVPKYRKAKITNKSDFKIRYELDEAESLATKFNYEAALEAFNKILKETPHSPRANYGRARTLELIAERQHSSGFLKKAIQAYEEVLRLPLVPPDLRTKTIRRLIEDCRFSGRFLKAVELHRQQLEMFPDDIESLNELGLTFLMMGRYEDAKNIFTDVLHKDPDNSTAHAYYGLILKTVDKDLKLAIDHLRKAISTDQWLIDDRFSQHLVDAIEQLVKEKAGDKR